MFLRSTGRATACVRWFAVGILVLAGCASVGPVRDPFAQRLTWFTYAAGSDIRDRCEPGSPDEYRFLYNGQYERQVRAYDLQARLDGGADLLVRARRAPGDLNRLRLDDPLGPWALAARRTTMTAAELADLTAALEQDAVAVPAAAGQRLNSYEFYWLVSRCRAGTFRLDAFRHLSVDHGSLTFPNRLLAHDTTGIPFRAARQFEGGRRNSFQLLINRAGDGV